MRIAVLVSVIITSLFIIPSTVVRAQDTFGPICDGVTVTCPPTPPPVISDTPVPQNLLQTITPTITPPPGAPPRSGHAETLLMFLGLSGICIAAGAFLRRSFVEA